MIELKQARVQQLEDFVRETCKMEPPQFSHPSYLEGLEDPFCPQQVISNTMQQ